MATAAGSLLAFAPGVPSAYAADLGGDCCSDLEERVAELEATTARKGNRKVSLTISGWVARELYVWDDGDMSDAYVVDTSTTLATHFKFSGKAEIKPGLRAGFVIHVEEAGAGSLQVNQINDEGAGESVISTLENKWYLESDRLGRVTVGQQSQASDNAAILADFSGTLVQSNWVLFDGASFFLRPKGSGAGGLAGLETNTWGGALGFCGHTGLGIGGDCNGVPTDAIRYDSPAMYGFIFSASWGENDFWDAALSYQAEWNSIKFKAAAAYDFFNDSGTTVGPNRNAKGSYFQVGAMAMHTPTGLFFYGAYGKENVDNRFIDAGAGTFEEAKSGNHWFAKAGIRRNWFSPGATVLYGEYGKYNDMFGGFSCGGTIAGTSIGDACGAGPIHVTGSELNRWGLGVVQEIDAASMSVWAKWVAFDGDIDFNDGKVNHSQDYEQLNSFLVGAMISF
jgi:hypothetical protein